MGKDLLSVELHDAFGTVIASGRIEVDSKAITPAALVDSDTPGVMSAVAGPAKRLRDLPLLAAVLASNYVQNNPLNPNFPLYVVIGPYDG